jgi:amidase
MTDDLIRLTATETVVLLRRGALSPLELVEAAEARIEAVETRVNALPVRGLEQARETARHWSKPSEDELARPGYLAGLPIAIKDYNDLAGLPTSYGSPIFRDTIASRSDVTVRTLQANGALPIAKSNVPEFAGANTFNTIFGATRNPWHVGRTAGGSSGGSAAALAAGEVWLATGNDLGGSLRIPASFCGVVGLRPSVGRVPRPAACLPYDPLWVEGPMGRCVADVALMLDAEAWPSPEDPLSLPRPESAFVAAVQASVGPKRIGFSSNLGLAKVEPEVTTICAAAVRRFEAMGAVVEEACPDFSGGIDCFQTLRAVLFAALRGELLATDRHRIAPEIIWNLEKGETLSADEVLRAERTRATIFRNTTEFFQNFDLLACPVVAVPPFPVEQRFPTQIAGENLTTYIDWMFLTFVLTLTGCPVISVPCGLTEDGLPVGLQIMARSRADHALLQAAALLEQEIGLAQQVPREPN